MRPTRMYCSPTALLHNLNRVKQSAPNQKVVVMVKANAYGCGIKNVIPVLDGHVDAFGVASFQEGMAIRSLGSRTECLLLQGFFGADELARVAEAGFQCVIHCREQLSLLLAADLPKKIQIWIKVDTGMHRLGFHPDEVYDVMQAVVACPWVKSEIGLMSHFACADELGSPSSLEQLVQFNDLRLPQLKLIRSMANSAAILSIPEAHADVVRPGIMLYGVSPFPNKIGTDLGLIPVMRLLSEITAIHEYPAYSPVGYGGTWQSEKPSVIGIVPCGYADGYPRHLHTQTSAFVNGVVVPIVGRVSMDMLTLDLSAIPNTKVGASVELWGEHIPIEDIAKSAETIAYELLTKVTTRVRNVSYG